MKNFLKSSLVKSLLIFITLFLCLNYLSLRGQSWRESLDSNALKDNGIWYCDSTKQYHLQYPMLTDIPPLNTGMPYEVLLSYIYCDSLINHASRYSYYSTLNYWKDNHIKNDTINGLIKYLYITQDYDPITFAQYSGEVVGDSIGVRNLITASRELLESISSPRVEYESLYELLQADYIFRVHINGIIDSSFAKSNRTDQNMMYYLVNATVLDTLKGKCFQTCNNNNNLYKKSDQINSNYPSICFIYVNGPYSHPGGYYQPDSTIKNTQGNITFSSGQDLIITLSHDDQLIDYYFDYFHLGLIVAYPIIEGQVKDLNHLWSESDYIDYDDWKSIFLSRKEMLLNGGY